MMRDALNLVHKFYSNSKLLVSDIRPTKLVEFENIASRFQVNIGLYEPMNQLAWRLVFGEVPDSSMANLPNIDIGLYEGHCFYIRELDVLANHWECGECQQRFGNYNRHIAENKCMGGQPKLVCPGEKFKRIMNTSEKVFCSGNAQFSWKACRWIEHQSKLIGRHIHHTLCGHGGERCVVISKNKILVDRFNSEVSTAYKFYRCKWHGCPCLETANDRAEHRYPQRMAIENQI